VWEGRYNQVKNSTLVLLPELLKQSTLKQNTIMLTFIDGKQISPCIASKAKYPLGLKKVEPNNCKSCSRFYWEKTVKRIGELNRVDSENIEKAKTKY